MSYVYFPSCNLTRASREASMMMRDHLKERMKVVGCCLYEKNEHQDEVALYVCQACRAQIENNLHMQTKSLWVWLNEESDFELPDYHGLRVTLQDCYRDNGHPEVRDAVRQLLKKMNVEVSEMEVNRDDTVYCGTLHYVPRSEVLKALVEKSEKISALDKEVQKALMKEQAELWEEDLVVTCCNRCLKGVQLAGRNGVHLMDLVCGTWQKI